MRKLVALVMIAAAAAGGCQVDGEVLIDVAEGGSGTVTVTALLDAEAAEAVGDPAESVRLDDLSAAGWELETESGEQGALAISVSKPFSEPAALQQTLDEVAEAGTLFTGWTLEAQHSFGGSRYRIEGETHLDGSLDQFSDAEVAALLDGLPVGRTPEELVAALADDPGAFTLRLVVEMPGEITEASGVTVSADRAERAASPDWPVLGTPVDERVAVSAHRSASGPVWTVAAGVVLVIAAAVLAGASERARRRRLRRSTRRRSPAGSPTRSNR